MEVFINECSLHEQFAEHAEFEVALQGFYQVLNALLTRGRDYQLYQRSDLLYVYKPVRSTKFITSLNDLPDKSFKNAINNVLHNKLNARDWVQEQIHSSDDVFMCIDEIVTDTSMAELAERLLCQIAENGVLINFPESKFLNMTSVNVNKNDEVSIDLDCVDSSSSLKTWLEFKFQSSRFEYDSNSQDPPLDSQTVLIDKQRFERTRLAHQGGRILYRERNTGYIWYVDSLHFGAAVHIEVFDSIGIHLGEADLGGNLDRLKRDANKRINT